MEQLQEFQLVEADPAMWLFIKYMVVEEIVERLIQMILLYYITQLEVL